MNLSIFDVLGPVMIGPSSSHTAGAARLGRISAIIAGKEFCKVRFGLHGSFEKTGIGHGTYSALLAGSLGIREDDKRMSNAYEIAKERGIIYEFYKEEMENCHENTVKITFYHKDHTSTTIIGSSIGGGQILITRINDTPVECDASMETLIVEHRDYPGLVHEITGLFVEQKINIATMKVWRTNKGDRATTILELDERLSKEMVEHIKNIEHIKQVIQIHMEG